MNDLSARISAALRDVADFPRPGILFKDITPVLADPVLFDAVISEMAGRYQGAGIEVVAGIESRGFILGGALALRLGAGFVPLRKPGKLPYDRIRIDYALEYGSDALEVHTDAVGRDARVLVVDDVLATGGTARAAVELMQRLDAHVEAMAFLLELRFLGGRDRIGGVPITTLLEIG